MNKISTALLLLGLTSGFTASAAEGDKRADAASCRQETKKVAVWPHGAPKAPTMARFELREVTVCDTKVSRQAAKSK